jgi:aspartate kinase
VGVIVQKYGGSSVADVARLKRVAERVSATRARGKQVVVVVSAMGHTTDELLALARQVSESPARRELDMLLSTGERISMALLSMALNDRGIPAVSFTGSQCGIMTNDSHNNARIVEVRPFRVQDELEAGRVVIVAGYQGVSYKREVTTLGRGGSDTTAVALAAALDAEACEIYSDVDGVYSADPRVVPEARRLSALSYEEMQELAEAGAKVLNAQAVEFAKEKGIALYCRATAGGEGETVVRRDPPSRAEGAIGVASEKDLVLVSSAAGGTETLTKLVEALEARQAAGKELLFRSQAGGLASVLLSRENLHDLDSIAAGLKAGGAGVEVRTGVGAVSAIGSGINARLGNLRKVLDSAAVLGAEVLGVSTSSFRISVLVDETHLPELTRRLHQALGEAEDPGRVPDSSGDGGRTPSE